MTSVKGRVLAEAGAVSAALAALKKPLIVDWVPMTN